jgi:hypothetical protein
LGVKATLDLNFIEDTPLIDKSVYGEAFPFEKPPRVWLEIFALDATPQEITEIVCEELIHIKHTELTEADVRKMVTEGDIMK